MTHMHNLLRLLVVVTIFLTPAFPQERGVRQLHQLVFGTSDPGEDVKCGLPAVAIALAQRDTASGLLRVQIDAALQRPILQKSVLAGRFRIHYDTSGTNAPALLNASHQRIPGTANAFADSVGSILSYVLRYETDSLGYLPPPPDNGSGGGTEYDIYINGMSSYGATYPESPIISKPDGSTYTSYMEIDNDFMFVVPDSNKGLPALRVTLAHELHHAIQMGQYGYWGNDIFFYEITSVWMEDVLFTEVNDYFQYLRASWGHFRNPEVPLNSPPGNFIVYSRGIWGQFIAKKYGRSVMRRAWEWMQSVRPLQAMNNALLEAPNYSSLREAFGEWTLWNYYTGTRHDPVRYYPEGRYYPNMLLNAVGFTPPARPIPGHLGALGGKYYQIILSADTLALILGNVNVAAAFSGSTTLFPFTFLLNTQQLDETYKATPVGIFVKLDVTDPGNWYSSDGVSGGTGPSSIAAGKPYPSPFLADGQKVVSIPVNGPNDMVGTISIFSSSMDLIYSEVQPATVPFGKPVFTWNGRDFDNQLAATGIYLYVVEVPGSVSRTADSYRYVDRYTGKIVLINATK